MKKANLSEQAMIGIIWTSVMSCVEWNKKEELVTEQAIKHLKVPSRTVTGIRVVFSKWLYDFISYETITAVLFTIFEEFQTQTIRNV